MHSVVVPALSRGGAALIEAEEAQPRVKSGVTTEE